MVRHAIIDLCNITERGKKRKKLPTNSTNTKQSEDETVDEENKVEKTKITTKKQSSSENIQIILKEIKQLNTLIRNDIAEQIIPEVEEEHKESIVNSLPKQEDKELQTIKDIVPVYLAERDGELDEQVYLEGELEKYRPGMSVLYIRRWCEVSFTHFKYYKSQWRSVYSLRKPIISIPFECVESIQRVDVKVPEKSKKHLFQFEIFLKKDVSLSLLAKNIEYSVDEKESVLSNKTTPGKSIANTKNSERKLGNTFINSQSCQADNADSLIESKNTIRGGHLMRSRTINRKLNHGNKPNKIKNEVIEYEGMRFKDKKQLKRFKKFKKKYEEEARTVIVIEKVNIKNPLGCISKLSSKVYNKVIDCNTWTNKECEWFEAEGRFLFACNDLALCNKWVVALNWLLSEFNAFNN